MKLRWIDLDLVDPKIVFAIWEYSRIFEMKDAVLFTVRHNKRVVETACNSKSADEDFYPEKLPEDVGVYRHHNTTKVKFGLGTWSPDVVGVYLHVPEDTDPKTIPLSLLKVLRSLGVNCYYENNDLFYVKDNKKKKFLGLMGIGWENGWMCLQAMFSFRIDIELLNNILRFDKEKFMKKKEFKSLDDIIGGLWDYNSELNMKDIEKLMATEIANRLNLEVYEDTLSVEEMDRILELACGLDTNDWIYNLIHPELGNVDRRSKI